MPLPAWVQEKPASETFTATLDSAPTDGNYLFAFGYERSAVPAVNTGWTSIGSQAVLGAAPGMRLVYRGPISGSSATQHPFIGSPAFNRGGVLLFEVSGPDIGTAVAAFATAPASGNATAAVNAVTLENNTLAIAFSGWVNTGPLTFTLSLDGAWTGPFISGLNTDDKVSVFGRRSVSGTGSTITATTTTGVTSYGLTAGLLLLGSNDTTSMPDTFAGEVSFEEALTVELSSSSRTEVSFEGKLSQDPPFICIQTEPATWARHTRDAPTWMLHSPAASPFVCIGDQPVDLGEIVLAYVNGDVLVDINGERLKFIG